MNHAMNPAAVFTLLLLALAIDYSSFGHDSFRDRAAFVVGLVTIHDGFNGSQLDHWTVGQLTTLINSLKGMAGGAYIAGIATQYAIAALVGIVILYAVGCMLPEKTPKLGAFAKFSFPTSAAKRLNFKLWTLAIFLGLVGDTTHGIVGGFYRGTISTVGHLIRPIPNWMFGV